VAVALVIGAAVVTPPSTLALVGGGDDDARLRGGQGRRRRAQARDGRHTRARGNPLQRGLPGPIATPVSLRAGRSGRPARLSELQPFVTGAVPTVDGGWTAR
jgi:hypothetical protein